MIEPLLMLCGGVLGLAGEWGLFFGLYFAFVAAVLVAGAAPSREFMEGLPFSLWLLLPMLMACGGKWLWRQYRGYSRKVEKLPRSR